MAVKQTAGRDALGEFAPKFAELNDDVLFGQVWSREDKLALRDRSIVTVVALSLEDRIEINTGHSEGFEVIQLLLDPPEIAAEIVVVQHLTLGGRLPVRLAVPVRS